MSTSPTPLPTHDDEALRKALPLSKEDAMSKNNLAAMSDMALDAAYTAASIYGSNTPERIEAMRLEIERRKKAKRSQAAPAA